jgi:hypothetical protein
MYVILYKLNIVSRLNRTQSNEFDFTVSVCYLHELLIIYSPVYLKKFCSFLYSKLLEEFKNLTP